MDNGVTSIDGSILEGGGQILRLSVSIASLLNIPIRIFNIRGRRSNPGLRAQHKTGLDLIHKMTPRSKLLGSEISSTEISFLPDQDHDNYHEDLTFSADTKTAGAITLLAQIALPKALFMGRRCTLMLRGGTDVPMSPTFTYFQKVFMPNLEKFGVSPIPEISASYKGYFPRGGGSVDLQITQPLLTSINPVRMDDRGDIIEIRIISSVAGNVPLSVAKKMCNSARRLIERGFQPSVRIIEDVYHESHAQGNGSTITIVASSSNQCILGGSSLGSPKVRPEITGEEAAKDLLASILDFPKACVDPYIQDQLILFMALSKGNSRIRTCSPLTLHTQTAIKVVETLTSASFTITTENLDDRDYCVIECKGIGYQFK
ncbi:RNA 3'-terminal phosphate cyclase [Lepeophtheirus salmonis]|uniref:RNA 3'-terminal phosphate cyclase n=1 Tax=Lepeophtheirus salmonis TaxID=72036 RepID=UPI001AE97F4A|nr:RNA 3'-terminal phosphate cyclase-like [Lepeophtheirus salmonis]